MSSFTTYTDNNLINAILRGTTFPLPANIYLALFTTMPTMPAGTGAIEPSTGGYARQAVGLTNFPAASGGSSQNGTTVSFAQATSPGYTNPVLGWGLYDAVTAGNLLLANTLQGTNDVWTLTLGTQTSGTFTMTVNSNATAVASWTLPFNPTAAEILEYLESIAAVGAGNVTVTGTGPWTITFVGAMGAQSVTMAGTFTGLSTPANASLTHTTTGSSGSFSVPTGGTVTFNANSLTISCQ